MIDGRHFELSVASVCLLPLLPPHSEGSMSFLCCRLAQSPARGGPMWPYVSGDTGGRVCPQGIGVRSKKSLKYQNRRSPAGLSGHVLHLTFLSDSRVCIFV